MALATLSSPTSAAIRALFVGVNQYQFSKPRVATAEFEDLKGTVNDVAHIKAALRDVYKLDLDTPATDCESANPVSTTLTDACATRAKIIAALDRRVAESAPGDTLLFYFAGHGARVRDDKDYDQPSGYDATILPTDARPPDEQAMVEILDRDIGRKIDAATAAGVNVVTIFDSCYSETATRDAAAPGRTRDAPPRTLPGLRRVPLAKPFAERQSGGQGYRVHLAAAREDEKSRERGDGATASGVFTTALAATLREFPGATFDDLLAETRRKVEEGGQSTQSPRGSGALRARLGGADSRIVLHDAVGQGTTARLLAGRLSGVTSGSRFALFDGSTAALAAEATPLATATVTDVNATGASLALDPGALALKPRLVAREMQHAFGTHDLFVRNAATGADRTRVSAAIAASEAAREGEPAQLVIAPATRAGDLALSTGGGRHLADLGPAADPRFNGMVADRVATVARANNLLALRTDPASAQIAFCVANDMNYDLKACPPLGAGERRTLVKDAKMRLVARNLSPTPRHLYVWVIDANYNVALALPEDRDAPSDSTRPLTAREGLEPAPDSAGVYRFVTLASDTPIDGRVFEQAGLGKRSVADCAATGPLQRALCAAVSRSRDPGAPRVGAWTAIVTDADVVDGAK